MARAAGRATGQAAAFLSRSRDKLLQLGKDNEIAEVHIPSWMHGCINSKNAFAPD